MSKNEAEERAYKLYSWRRRHGCEVWRSEWRTMALLLNRDMVDVVLSFVNRFESEHLTEDELLQLDIEYLQDTLKAGMPCEGEWEEPCACIVKAEKPYRFY